MSHASGPATGDARAVLIARAVLGVAGVAGAAYGLSLLVRQPLDRLVDTALWVVGGVLAHDAVIAPVVVVLGVLAARGAPDWLRVPLVRLLVVVGPLTLVAVPVLGRFGARPDNPTLLDRPYWAAYLVVVVLALAFTAVSALRRRRATTAPPTTA